MKKIFAFILILVFSFNISFSYASSENTERNKNIKQLIVSKNKLQQTSKGKKYIKKINLFIEKNGENKKILEKINKKLSTLLEKSSDNNSETFDIIKYMNAKINISLLSIIEKEKENPYFEDISEDDKQKVEEEIVNLQLNLFNKTTDYFEILIEDFEKLTNYEDKGDFSMNLSLDHEDIGKIDSYFNFNDYSVKASNFDSELNGQIEALIEASIKGEDELKIKISGFIDFISKDGNMYLLLEKLNVTDEKNIDDLKEIIETAKKIASENKYIEFNDSNSKEAVKILNSLTPSKIINGGKSILSKPMFEAYKKDGEKILLKPTKYACDSFKELGNKFDPFNGKDCSEGQYKNMLEDLAEVGTIYIILGENNEIGFNFMENNDEYNGAITYNDKNIENFNFNILPDQNKYPDEGLEIEYKRNDSLNAFLNADDGDVYYNFNSKLDSNNNFSEIDFKGHTASSYNNFAIVLGLKDNNIEGEIEINNSSYDWQTGEYKESSKINAEISGTTDYKNHLSTLNINTKGINIEDDSNFLTSDFVYDRGYFSYNNYFTSEYIGYDFEIDGRWDSSNKNISEGGVLLSIKSKDYYSEDDSFIEVFKTDINLKNKLISGTTNISDGTKDYATITHSGKYEKKYLKLDNFIELENNPFNTFGQQINSARDNTRYYDIYALAGSIEQSYQDYAEYPSKENFNERVKIYMNTVPEDPSGNIEIDGCEFGYHYQVGTDANGIEKQWYRLSACVETISYGKYDYGTDDMKYEYGYGYYNDLEASESFYINGYNSWTKQEIVEEKEPSVTSNLNFLIDQKNSDKDFNIYYDLLLDSNKVIEFNINNEYERTFKDIEIKAPSNTMEFEKFLKNYSLGGYSMDARNSKRVSDISNIHSAISLRQVEGAPLTSFVVQNDKYKGEDIYVGGNKLVFGEDYFVGTPNYSALNIYPDDFKDPDGSEYIIGVSTKGHGVIQIFTKLEYTTGNEALIYGTFVARTKKDISFTINENNSSYAVIKISDNNANYFKNKDITSLGKVTKVSRDGTLITLENNISESVKTISLLKSDSKGLIKINGKMVENGDSIDY